MSRRSRLVEHLTRSFFPRRRAGRHNRRAPALLRRVQFEPLESRVVLDGLAFLNTAPPVANDDWTLIDAGKPATIRILDNDTDPDAHPFTQVIITQSPTRGFWHLNPDDPATPEYDATVTYTPASAFVGTDTFRYKVRDSLGEDSNEATVTITSAERVEVDLVQKASLNLAAGEQLYHLVTTHNALLTLVAGFDPGAGGVLLKLHDGTFDPADPDASLLETQNQRMDRLVGAGEDYYLSVSGTSADVDLVMANLFRQDGAAIQVYGTTRNDGLDVSATAVSIKDIAGDFSARYDVAAFATLTFDAGDGLDEAVIRGTAGDDTVDVTIDESGDGSITVAGLAFTATLNSVADATVAGNGGADTARLHGTASNDRFENASGTPLLTSGAFRIAAQEFATIEAYAGLGGDDEANLVDSSNDDTFTTAPGSATLARSDYTLKAFGFPKVVASAINGGHDTAQLVGSARSDTLTATPETVTLASGGWTMIAARFDEVCATAGAGGTDKAFFTDSAGNDTLTAQLDAGAPVVTLEGTGYAVKAEAFPVVVASASQGDDVANLSGSDGDDTLTGRPDRATLVGTGFSFEVQGFGAVHAEAGAGAEDVARLYDSSGDDTFTAYPDTATLGGNGFLLEAKGFDVVNAYSTAGGNDTAQLYGSDQADTFSSSPDAADPAQNIARMYRSGAYHNRAVGFEEVFAYGEEGNDAIRLQETAGNDVLTLTTAQIAFAAAQFVVYAEGFEYTPGFGYLSFDAGTLTGDADTAHLYDGPDADRFVGRPAEASLATGTVTRFAVRNFRTVHAHSTAGGEDAAQLIGSAGNDTLNASPDAVELSGADYTLIASGFWQTEANGTSQGADTGTLNGTSGDDSLRGGPNSVVLALSTGATISALRFPSLTILGAGGNNTASLYESPADDTLTIRPSQVDFTGSGFALQLQGFARARVNASTTATDSDRARLYDSSGDDTLVAAPGEARFSGTAFEHVLLGFSTLEAYANAGGTDTARLSGSAGDDTFRGRPQAGLSTFAGSGFTFRIDQFEQVFADGKEGRDDVHIQETSGNDTFTLRPSGIEFSGAGQTISTTGFEHTGNYAGLVADAGTFTTDSDTAHLYDGPEADLFVARSNLATLTGAGVHLTAKNFRTVHGHATDSGKDTARLFDTAGNDTLTASAASAQLASTNDTLIASGFEVLQAYARAGGKDQATLDDSSGNDVLEARFNDVKLRFANGSLQQVVEFDTVVVRAVNGGDDTAKLYDSPANDTLTSKAGKVSFTGANYNIQTEGFEHLRAFADAYQGDSDTANLYDTAGNDTLRATPTAARFVGTGLDDLVTGFGKVVASAETGGTDIAALFGSSGSDSFIASSTLARLHGAGYQIEVSKFDQVRADAGSGANDVAELYDSSGNDVLTATPTVATLKGTDYVLRAAAFDVVYAYSNNGGQDTAKLFGSAGSDTFTSRPGQAVLSGAEFSNTATNFERVQAFAGSSPGGADTATLYDSALNDLFTAEGKKASIAAFFTAYFVEVDSFQKVTAVGSTGNNFRDVKGYDFLLEFQGNWV